jgi:hypothetical protein
LRFWGSLTLTISSLGGVPGFFSVSATSPFPAVFADFVCLIVGAGENIFIPSPESRPREDQLTTLPL